MKDPLASCVRLSRKLRMLTVACEVYCASVRTLMEFVSATSVPVLLL